jgi:hypothetical protein
MKTKVKVVVYPATENEDPGYWVCVCICLGSYFKHMEKSRVHCKDKLAMTEAVWNALHNKVCPECGHVFSTHGWDGIDAHWRSKHENVMSYENAWKLISEDKYVEVMLASAE